MVGFFRLTSLASYPTDKISKFLLKCIGVKSDSKQKKGVLYQLDKYPSSSISDIRCLTFRNHEKIEMHLQHESEVNWFQYSLAYILLCQCQNFLRIGHCDIPKFRKPSDFRFFKMRVLVRKMDCSVF